MKQTTAEVSSKKQKRIMEDPLPTVTESNYSSFNKSSPCFLRTVKGALKLCDEYGYRFIRNRVEGTKTYWNCERKKTECKARAISNSEECGVVFNDISHNHLPPMLEKLGNSRERLAQVPNKIQEVSNALKKFGELMFSFSNSMQVDSYRFKPKGKSSPSHRSEDGPLKEDIRKVFFLYS